jgi:hypothetical protein
MIVKQLLKVKQNLIGIEAERFSTMLKRQKLGYRIDQYCNKTAVIDSILIDAIVEANKPLALTDKARVPAWSTKDQFNKFISKITYYDSNIS